MSAPRDEGVQAALDRILKDYSLARDTRLYREAMRDALTPTDVLRQGGLIYPVESVSVEQVWYCTLPAESIDVREAM